MYAFHILANIFVWVIVAAACCAGYLAWILNRRNRLEYRRLQLIEAVNRLNEQLARAALLAEGSLTGYALQRFQSATAQRDQAVTLLTSPNAEEDDDQKERLGEISRLIESSTLDAQYVQCHGTAMLTDEAGLALRVAAAQRAAS